MRDGILLYYYIREFMKPRGGGALGRYKMCFEFMKPRGAEEPLVQYIFRPGCGDLTVGRSQYAARMY